MTLTDLTKSGLYPTTSKALAIRDYHSYNCPYGEFFECFHYADCCGSRLVQCGIIRTSLGYSVVTYNCSLFQDNYPVDYWQCDRKYSSTDRAFAFHHYHLLVHKLVKKELHFTTEESFAYVQ